MKQPERLSRKVVYEGPWVNLYLDKVKFPNGVVIDDFNLLDFPRAGVVALVENDRGNIILVKVCRYTTGRTEWEVPAGGVEAGESELDAARREVLEETGFGSRYHKLIYTFYPISGIGNKVFHVVHCKAADKVQDFDKTEVSETAWFSRSEIKRMVKEKAISDGFSLTALLLWLQV